MENEIKTVYGCEEIIEVPMKTFKDKLRELIDKKNELIEDYKEFVVIDTIIVFHIILIVLVFLSI